MLSAVQRSRLEREVIGSLGYSGTKEPSAVALLAETLPDLLEADASGVYTLHREETFFVAAPFHGRGLDVHLTHRLLNENLRANWRTALAFDPARPAPSQRNRPLTRADVVQLNSGVPGTFAGSFGRLRIERSDQLRVLFCDGARTLGLAAVFRDSPFSGRESTAFRRLVRPIQERLMMERRLRDMPLYEVGLKATLEAISTEAYVLRTNGQTLSIVEMNVAGSAAFEGDGRALMEELRRAISRGAQEAFVVTRLALRDAPPHYLVIRRVSSNNQLGPRLQRAAQDWKLTGRQRAVLERLVRGAPNKLIAQELGCAEVTVETHITALFSKSGATSRAELIARFWTVQI